MRTIPLALAMLTLSVVGVADLAAQTPKVKFEIAEDDRPATFIDGVPVNTDTVPSIAAYVRCDSLIVRGKSTLGMGGFAIVPSMSLVADTMALQLGVRKVSGALNTRGSVDFLWKLTVSAISASVTHVRLLDATSSAINYPRLQVNSPRFRECHLPSH